MKARYLCLLAFLVIGVASCKTTSTPSGGGMPSAGGAMPGGAMPSSPMPGTFSDGTSSDGTSSGSSTTGSSNSASGNSSGSSSGSSGTTSETGSSNIPDGKSGSGGTSGKSVEVLDGELDDSLGEFEGKVSDAGTSSGEIDILDPTGRNTGGISAGVPVFEDAEIGSGDVENPDIEERANEGYEGADSDTVASSDGVEGAANIPIPEDIGEGRGDDIVLRQIREAAMKEPDPVLREKLWDEYRRIKGQ